MYPKDKFICSIVKILVHIFIGQCFFFPLLKVLECFYIFIPKHTSTYRTLLYMLIQIAVSVVNCIMSKRQIVGFCSFCSHLSVYGKCHPMYIWSFTQFDIHRYQYYTKCLYAILVETLCPKCCRAEFYILFISATCLNYDEVFVHDWNYLRFDLFVEMLQEYDHVLPFYIQLDTSIYNTCNTYN